MSRPAVFLDRDGTLIEDREYLSDPAGVRLLPGVAEALTRLGAAGFALIVVTNQSGIGRGWMTVDDYQRVAAELDRQLGERGVRLDASYYCPAAPAEPECEEHPERKPNPGLYARAARDNNLDMAASYSIGDSLRDLLAGRDAGCRAGILVRTGKPIPRCEEEIAKEWHIVADLASAADWILQAN